MPRRASSDGNPCRLSLCGPPSQGDEGGLIVRGALLRVLDIELETTDRLDLRKHSHRGGDTLEN
eukprot:8178753-Lingulodinium_polyedra.AAC.1